MASRRVRRWLVSILSVVPLCALAESGWQLGVGASYRDFDDVELTALRLNNFGNTDATVAPLGLQGYTNANTGGFTGALAVDHARYTGGDAEVDGSDQVGVALAAVQPLGVWEGIRLNLVVGAQLFQTELAAIAAPTDFETFSYNHVVVAGVFSDPQALVPPVPPNPGLQAGTTAWVRNDFDMNLVVLDLGLQAAYGGDRLSCYVAAGPSLSMADVETTQNHRATWNTFGLPNTGNYSAEETEDDLNLLVGGYVAVGAGIAINEQFGLAAEARYDLVHREAGTSQATLDLDGASGQIKLTYDF